MKLPRHVEDTITRVLKSESRKGQTTKNTVTMLVLNELSRGGGVGAWMPPALAHVVARNMIATGVDRHFKFGLPDNVIHQVLSNAPPELVQVMPKLPRWICIGEGPDAVWVLSLQATAEQWMANAKLKQKKARQTQDRADASAEMARYLMHYGLRSLSENIYADAAE